MRSFLVTIFLLLSIVGDAQNYKLKYKVNFGFSVTDRNRYYNHMYYTTLYDPTPREVDDFYMYQQNDPDPKKGKKGDHLVEGSVNIDANKGPITRIWIRTERQWELGGVWYTHCEIPKDRNKPPLEPGTTIYLNFLPVPSITPHAFTKADIGFWGWGCLGELTGSLAWERGPVPITVDTFQLTPDLTITSSPNDNLIPTNDNIKLQATAGFIPEMYKWEWFYTTWNSMPARCQSVPSFDINAADLFGTVAAAESHIGENLQFRINYGGGYYSTPLILSIRPPSPHIIRVDPIPPTCYGDKNGSAKIYFDRALWTDELLSITLKDNSRGVDLVGKNNLDKNSLGADNSIKLDYNLGDGQYTIGLNGSYKGVRTYTEALGHKFTFPITDPSPLSYNITTDDVRCYGNNDGAIKVTASGGTPNYLVWYKKSTDPGWQNFSTPNTHIITGLAPATYNVKVTDAHNCDGKNAKNEVIETITINQPKESLKIDNSDPIPPKGAGLKDGKIIVRIKGGKPKTDGSYTLIWKDALGTILSTGIVNALDILDRTIYITELQNRGKGKYYLTVIDANACQLDTSFILTEPPPILINIVQQKNILCKGNAAGELVAHVSGGVPYTEGPTIPYEYQWFKREATDIEVGKTDSIASDLKAGDYVVKITDSNKIEKISDVFTITEPDSLKIHFTTTVNSCKGTQNISATITGGTAPYHIEWPTGDTTTTINDIPETLCDKSPCMVEVTDVYGCKLFTPLQLIISGTITIDAAIIKNPSYYSSKDGSIQLTISKGTPPYTYRWSNGATTKDLQNLAAGTYSLLITDDSGCIKTQTFTLQNPPRIIHVDSTSLGNNNTKTLCNGQSLNIDATIPDNAATYQWSSNNGFTANTPKVTLTATGEYWIKVTDSRSVTASDTVIIKRSTADINARFLVSTQAFAGEKLTFVNISRPLPERIEWLIPNNPKIEIIQVNQELAQLIFKDTGTYIIGMKSIVGECEQTVTKKLIVVRSQQFDDIGITNNPFIKEFTIMPNPNTGQFNVKVVLQEQSKIRLRMMNITSSAIINDQELSGSSQYIIPYTISAASGAYILLLETPKGNQIQKIIIN